MQACCASGLLVMHLLSCAPSLLLPTLTPTPLTLQQVVVSTCNGSGESRLEDQRFRIVVLDEASQVGGWWGERDGGLANQWLHCLPCLRAGALLAVLCWRLLLSYTQAPLLPSTAAHESRRPRSPPRWCRWSRAQSA